MKFILISICTFLLLFLTTGYKKTYSLQDHRSGQINFKVKTYNTSGESGYSPIIMVFNPVASLQISYRNGMDNTNGKSYSQKNEQSMMIAHNAFDDKGYLLYRNLETKQVIFRNKKIPPIPAHIVYENWIDINWQVNNKFKTIAGYKVQNATGLFRGRKWTVWFAKDIPYPYGPEMLHGLPGMILEASSEWFHYIAESVCLPCDTELPEAPKEDRSYTIKEYTRVKDNLPIYSMLEFHKKGHTFMKCLNIPDEKIIWESRQYQQSVLYEWEDKSTKRAITNKDTLDATVNYEGAEELKDEVRQARELPTKFLKKPASQTSTPLPVSTYRGGKG